MIITTTVLTSDASFSAVVTDLASAPLVSLVSTTSACNLTKICSEKSSIIQTTYYTASFRRSAVLLTSSVLAHIKESYLTVSRALQILLSLHVCYFITLIDLCSCFLFFVCFYHCATAF